MSENAFKKLKQFRALNKDEVKSILDLVERKKFHVAQIAGDSKLDKPSRTYRSAEVSNLHFSESPALYKLTMKLVEIVEKFYKTPISNYTSHYQLIRYETGDFYKKHEDVTEKKSPKRVLSVVFFLSDPLEYEGGYLRVYSGEKSIRMPQESGTGVIFPSTMLHEVTPVTAGTRFVLVTWLKDFAPAENNNEPL